MNIRKWIQFLNLSACPEMFQCDNKRCVKPTMRCDGWNDCGDSSDEKNCRKSSMNNVFIQTHNCTLALWMWIWAQTYTVIDWIWMFLISECDATMIQCKNGFCKPPFWKCDGVNDCGDNTDEMNCGKTLCPPIFSFLFWNLKNTASTGYIRKRHQDAPEFIVFETSYIQNMPSSGQT